MNTKWKIIIMVMLIIISICGIFITLFTLECQNNLENFATNKIASMRALIQTIEEENSRNYRNRIQSFINYTDFPKREKIITAFVRRDREELLQLTTPFFRLLRKENPIFATFSWITPDNRIFLRVHNPTFFGDDISTKRPDIVDANKEQRQHAAYKVSGTGLLYSIDQPVSYKDQHVGILQFGLKESSLLDNLYKKLTHPVGVAIPNETFSFVTNPKLPFVAGSSHTIQSKQLDLFQEGAGMIDWTLGQQKVTLHGTTYIVANIFNLLNYKQEPEGYIFVALDISEQEKRLQEHIRLIFIISVVLLLLSFFLLYSSYGSLVQKIINLNQNLAKNNLELENKIIERTADLAEEKERLQAITENVPGVVFQFYANKTGEAGVHYVSPKLLEIFGLEFIEDPSLFFQTFSQNIHKKDKQSWGESIKNAIEKQIPWKWKGRYVKPSGEIVWFEGQSIPTVRKDEIVFDGLIIDITDEIKNEVQRLEITRQQEQLKKFESLKTMAGAIAHRFNNDMMVVMGNLELVLETLPDGSDEHQIALEAALAARGASKVGSMMLSYVSPLSLKCQKLPFFNVVKEKVTALKSHLLPHISLLITAPDQPLYCSIDQQQINEVIESILTNAAESLDEGSGKIEITFGSEYFGKDSFPVVFQDDKLQSRMYAFCQIKDTGHGIVPEDLPRIFEPFYSTRFVGRGLGLAMTVGVMRAHHGAITVESSPDKGTSVRILFPSIATTQPG
jgi:PAS domain S-box-containing protein